MCASEGADKCASEGADAAKECASEGAEVCASEAADKCASEGAGGVKECASEGADSGNANGGCFIKNDGNVNVGFVTEAPTVPESMLFGMYAWNIYAPLPWSVAVEPFLFSTTGVSTTGQRCLRWRVVRLLGGWACC